MKYEKCGITKPDYSSMIQNMNLREIIRENKHNKGKYETVWEYARRMRNNPFRPNKINIKFSSIAFKLDKQKKQTAKEIEEAFQEAITEYEEKYTKG